MIIQTQTFSFSPAQPGLQLQMQAGTIANVPLDGSAQVTVPFVSNYLANVQSVQLQYNPASETDYQISTEIIGTPSLSGFVMVATGGPTGTTGNFTFIASGY